MTHHWLPTRAADKRTFLIAHEGSVSAIAGDPYVIDTAGDTYALGTALGNAPIATYPTLDQAKVAYLMLLSAGQHTNREK